MDNNQKGKRRMLLKAPFKKLLNKYGARSASPDPSGHGNARSSTMGSKTASTVEMSGGPLAGTSSPGGDSGHNNEVRIAGPDAVDDDVHAPVDPVDIVDNAEVDEDVNNNGSMLKEGGAGAGVGARTDVDEIGEDVHAQVNPADDAQGVVDKDDDDHLVLEGGAGGGVSKEEDSGTKDLSKMRRAGSLAYEAVKESLRLIVRVTDAVPVVKSATQGVLEVFERFDAVRGIPDELNDLKENLDKIILILEDNDYRDRLSGLARVFEEKTQIIKTKLGRNMAARIIESTEDIKFMTREIRAITFAIDIVMMNVSLKTNAIVSNLHHIALLDKLKYVEGAGFGHEDRQGCVNGTRMLLLADLLTWATEPKTEHVFWLNGMAGTGKTTVAETLCNLLSGKGALGSSFFCSRKSADRRKINLVFPSLARALAHKYPEFEKQLVLVLQKCLDPTGMDLEQQFETLLIEPARIAFENHSGSIVLAVDALDECEDQQAAEKFLRIILKERSPGCLRFFVTSRPEAKIRKGFSAGAHAGLRLQDIEEHIIKSDIRVYLQTSFEEIEDLQSEYDGHWPPAELDVIVENSGILFIYAATAVKYISDDRGDPVARLRKFASLAPPPNAVAAIDEVYLFVLRETFLRLDSDERERVQLCLQTAVCALEPLSVTMYSTLLGIKVHQVKRAFASLHSVVQMPKYNDHEITLYHTSFLDYLTDINRTHSPDWHVDVVVGHRMIASQCLHLMMSELHFNIAKAYTSYKSNQELNLEVPYILEYTCGFWANHVLLSLKGSIPLPDILALKIENFLSEKFLFWLEVLSVIDSAQLASVSLFCLYQLVDSPDLKAICRELSMFISKHLVAIQFSTPHIYLSALPWVSTTSFLGQKYLPKFSNLPKIIDEEEPNAWEPLITQLLGHTGLVNHVVYSPDGKLIASASYDETIRVWDADTGQERLRIVPDIAGAYHSIFSIVFSPTSREIIAGINNSTFQVWNVETGELKLETLQGYLDGITSVAISPDGKYIALGLSNKTVKVWDARSGKQVHKALAGHLYTVLCVAFSSDSLQLVSGSTNGSILFWDITTGALVYEIQGQVEDEQSTSCMAFSHNGNYVLYASQILGHIEIWNLTTKVKEQAFSWDEMTIMAAAFSYDRKYIALGLLGGIVKVYDSYTGIEVLILSSHTSGLSSVAFSPNGYSIVLGEATIQVCHIKDALEKYDYPREPNKQLISIDQNTSKNDAHYNAPFTAHNGLVWSVAFSPNSKYLTSGSYRTVGVWNIDIGTLEYPFLQHIGNVSAVAWSPDWKLIASGSDDCLIRLWNAETGLLESELKGHEYIVNCVAFSPDGLYLASGSNDKTVRLWSIAISKQICKPMLGHSRVINSVAYSPDGKLIVSASDDHTLKIWDAETNTRPLSACLRGHTDDVRSAVFTPDGKFIISGGRDECVIIWDSSTHNLLKKLRGHCSGITSIAITPDSKYAFSGSHDHSILIWDLAEQEKLDLSLNGHEETVSSLAVSPNGRFVASGSFDWTIRVWDITTLLKSENPKSGHCTLQNYSPIPYFLHGWYCNNEGYFLWVPPSKLASVYTPHTYSIIGDKNKITIELDKFVHGTQWHTCLEL